MTNNEKIPGIIDSHAHYENKQFKKDRDAILASLPSLGIEMVINSGCDIPSCYDVIKIAEKYPHAYATVGVHPHEAKTLSKKSLKELENLCNHPKVVAYGEIGLDFHYDFSPRDVQREWFKQQLDLAGRLNLPVVIHSREAQEEVYKIIEASEIRKGVIHSFSGDSEIAKAYVKLGFHIGINGVVTFDKTNTIQQAVAEIPLQRILLETDCPYLTPKPYRGKRNESKYLIHVAEEIAKIKGETVKTVCAQTTENTKFLFGL